MRSQVKTQAEFFKAARAKAGVSQMDAAKHLKHTTAQYISNLERGLCAPSVEMGIVLCKFYGTSLKTYHAVLLDEYKRQLKVRFNKRTRQ